MTQNSFSPDPLWISFLSILRMADKMLSYLLPPTSLWVDHQASAASACSHVRAILQRQNSVKDCVSAHELNNLYHWIWNLPQKAE